MACSRPNSPCSSHHFEERRLKCSISDAWTDDFGLACAPGLEGLGESRRSLDDEANDRTDLVFGSNVEDFKGSMDLSKHSSEQTMARGREGRQGHEATHWQATPPERDSKRAVDLAPLLVAIDMSSGYETVLGIKGVEVQRKEECHEGLQ